MTLSGVPTWAQGVTGAVPGCLTDDMQLVDMTDGAFSAACITEHPVGADGIVATFTYRAAEAIDPTTVTLTAQVSGPSMTTLPATFTVESR